ncbi:DUF29 domain-containing protein [Baaleninema simplex]|uniref:DUF29 domain-containing protein n=1 Tax=Baaleninema simplex TaxID=2862350 RepID=UPI0004782B36|nr:DUF29 domain-containing protein [Baaleninema simplex]
MAVEPQTTTQHLYETDYLRWIEVTIAQLRRREIENLDWENLCEELEGMARRERRSLKSNLVVLLLHLLKWQHQPQQRSGSWKGSIVEHRRRIRDALQDSPSLKGYLVQVLDTCYEDAIEQACAETGLSAEVFPDRCPYTVEQIEERSFFPQG